MAKELNVLLFLEEQCHANNVSTFLTHAPNGGALVYVSRSETDPMGSLLRAALDVTMKRVEMGLPVNQDQIKVERQVLVTDPEHAYSWMAKDETQTVIDSGYARTEFEAKAKIADAFRLHEARKNGL